MVYYIRIGFLLFITQIVDLPRRRRTFFAPISISIFSLAPPCTVIWEKEGRVRKKIGGNEPRPHFERIEAGKISIALPPSWWWERPFA